jgi:hypothetical protein
MFTSNKTPVHGKQSDIWAAGLTLYSLAIQSNPYGKYHGYEQL